MATLQERLDRVFSLFVRVSSADHAGFSECFTCGVRIPWQEGDAGHFIPRGNNATRYDEDNVRFQCIECNRNHGGMEVSFEEHLRDDLGDEAVDALIVKSRTTYQFTDEAYRRLIQIYTETLKRLGVRM